MHLIFVNYFSLLYLSFIVTCNFYMPTVLTTTAVSTTTTTAATEPEFVFTDEMRLEYEKEAARLINEFRAENGMSPLEWDETLHQAVRISPC